MYRTNIRELREDLEDYLKGLRICDFITEEERENVLKDFDNWCKTAIVGDTYYYDDIALTVELIL